MCDDYIFNSHVTRYLIVSGAMPNVRAFVEHSTLLCDVMDCHVKDDALLAKSSLFKCRRAVYTRTVQGHRRAVWTGEVKHVDRFMYCVGSMIGYVSTSDPGLMYDGRHTM